MRPTIALLLTIVAFQPGCGSSTDIAVESVPEPELSFAEWQKIEDPEEKFNPQTVRRLPKKDRETVAKLASKIK